MSVVFLEMAYLVTFSKVTLVSPTCTMMFVGLGRLPQAFELYFDYESRYSVGGLSGQSGYNCRSFDHLAYLSLGNFVTFKIHLSNLFH